MGVEDPGAPASTERRPEINRASAILSSADHQLRVLAQLAHHGRDFDCRPGSPQQ